jgi:membrane associated rhomboid family serine protease
VTSPSDGTVAGVGEQYCYRHPGEATGVRCVRCDRPICPQCMTPASVGFQCPECIAQGSKTVRQARTIYGGRARPTSGRMGPVTTTLIAVNVVIFIATSAGGLNFASGGGTSSLFQHLSLIPPAVGHGQWYRLVTAMFLHFNVIHIAFNMYALFAIGPPLEAVLGRVRYLGLYFLAGIGGSMLTLVGAPLATESAGASGAIFGLFAAFYIVARRQGWQTNSIVITIVLNLALSFSFSSEIDWRGHVGGLIIGAVVMGIFAYAPVGPQRARLQALGAAGVVVLLVAVGLIGVHRVNNDCRSLEPLDNGSSAQLVSTSNIDNVAFCQHFDPR